MADYIIRKDSTAKYTVSKWDGKKKPSEVYTVWKTNSGWKCSCPAGRKMGNNDKHVKLVKKWEKDGSPMKIVEGKLSGMKVGQMFIGGTK